jgi:Fe2+ transport system protein FeoA
MLSSWLRRRTAARCPVPCPGTCDESCPLDLLPPGVRAIVISIGCPVADATRLRTLGVFEGAHVAVVHRRSGLLLDVRGTRLALDVAAAAAIIAMPLRG